MAEKATSKLRDELRNIKIAGAGERGQAQNRCRNPELFCDMDFYDNHAFIEYGFVCQFCEVHFYDNYCILMCLLAFDVANHNRAHRRSRESARSPPRVCRHCSERCNRCGSSRRKGRCNSPVLMPIRCQRVCMSVGTSVAKIVCLPLHVSVIVSWVASSLAAFCLTAFLWFSFRVTAFFRDHFV